MEKIALKHPPGHYAKRFNRFLWLLISVRGMAPRNRHLWKVMDGVPFQDTETALEVALLNQGKTLDAAQAERLSFAINRGGRAVAPHTPNRATEQVTAIDGFHALAADPAALLTDEQRLAYAGQARAVAEIAAIETDTHWRALTLICGPGNGP